jgi:hypothetical protein
MTNDNITQEYDKSTRSPKTGKLYMPSLKWGGWTVTCGGIRHSFGSSLYNTRGKAIQAAQIEAKSLNAIIYLFSRKEDGCKLSAVITQEGVNNDIAGLDKSK